MPDVYDEARTLADRKVELAGNGYVESISLNMKKPQFRDPKVREALYLAVDKARIIEAEIKCLRGRWIMFRELSPDAMGND